jgi:hypothetical protein
VARVDRRLEDLRLRPVAVEVRVREEEDGPDGGPDGSPEAVLRTHASLCWQDYHDNEHALFELLVRNLPFAQWGRVTVTATGDLAFRRPYVIYPAPSPWDPDNPVDFSEGAVQTECDEMFREQMMGILDYDDLMEGAVDHRSANNV